MGTQRIREKEDIEAAIERYTDMISKIAYSYTKNKETAEDMTQNVFLKYMTNTNEFCEEAHKKAWLIRVTINECKKYFRRLNLQFKHPVPDILKPPEHSEVYDAVMQLPQKYRVAIHLYYYEELSVKEISLILKKNENTILSLLHRARQKLKKIMEEEYGYHRI